MGITSSSTLQDVVGQYNDNLAWENNPTKAALALEAVRWLIVNRPSSLKSDMFERGFSIELLGAEKNRIEKYLKQINSVSKRVTFTKARAIL